MVEYPETLDGNPLVARKRGWWRFVTRQVPRFAFLLLVAFLAMAVLWRFIVVTVPPGHVGVLWKRFNTFDFYCWCFGGRGTMVNPQQLRGEGLHLIWPWDRLFLYNLRLQYNAQTYNAISKDGVNVGAQINTRFQLLNNSVGVLHKFIGPSYLESVISPEIGSQARQVISQYTAQEVYTSREVIQERIRDNARKGLGANLNRLVQPEAMEQPDPKNYNDFLQYSIQILDTLVLSIELPLPIVGAINRQTEQFYLIQEYRYRVAREAEESKRKQVEANGIAAFQQTVSQGISESYLRWRGIEATLALSQSPNSKIVVIGGGKDGLPIILGNIDSPAPVTPPKGSGAPPVSDKGPGSHSTLHDLFAPAAPTGAPEAGATKGQTPAGGTPQENTGPTLNNAPPGGWPSPPAKLDKPTTFNPFDLSTYESILSRITGPLRSGPPPATEGASKQDERR